MKKASKILAIVVMCSLSLFVSLSDGEVLIESEESRTASGQSVFNRIRWIPGREIDIWMMNQSHHGTAASADEWDRLAIVVDKEAKTARYFQFRPGPLEWSESLSKQEFRASCFTCHNNGPRAIRPQLSAGALPLSLGDRLEVAVWNLRIKTYGRLVTHPDQEKEETTRKIHFRWHDAVANEKLQAASCTKCHRDEGFPARGALHRQQGQTILNLIENGSMPPPGFSMDENDRREIERFAVGL